MATTPVYQPDPATRVRTTSRLWSEEVAKVEALEPLKRDKAYRFGNGREFDQPRNPYATEPEA